MQAIEEKENVEIAESSRPIDILNREDIVNHIMDLVNAVSESRGSCTFSLNGSWGVGKSFVLNILEEKLLTYHAGTRYVVFHYNCWKYDYYEEPLFAIVAAMLEGINEETHFFSRDARNKAKAAFELAKPVLKRIAAEASKNLIGFDAVKLFAMVKNGEKEFEDVIESEEKATGADDPFFHFNRTLQNVREQMKALTRDRTIVVVVDELDRCLPTYAIKVLERLHHLFYGIENCVVMVSMDKNQLDNTVHQVFGDQIDIEHYLKKFIDFQMKLEPGSIQGKFSEKYADYFAMFDENLIDSSFDVDEFCAALFGDNSWEMRDKDNLMKRISTIHRILFSMDKKDYSFLCMELLWTVLLEVYQMDKMMPIQRDDTGRFGLKYSQYNTRKPYVFEKYLKDRWDIRTEPYRAGSYGVERIDWRVFVKPIDIPQLLVAYLQEMFSDRNEIIYIPKDTPRSEEYDKNAEEFKRFADLLKIIK